MQQFDLIRRADHHGFDTAVRIEDKVDQRARHAGPARCSWPRRCPGGNHRDTTGATYSFVDGTWQSGDQYRVYAVNVVGDSWDYSDPNINELIAGTPPFPVVTTKSTFSDMKSTP